MLQILECDAEDDFVAFRQSTFWRLPWRGCALAIVPKLPTKYLVASSDAAKKTGLCGLASDFRWGLSSLMLCDCLNCCQQITTNPLYH